MIAEKAEYKYIICKDIFEIYHPNEKYTIQEILKEYKIKPTNPISITYIYNYNDAKEDFKKFFIENDLKCGHGNGLHGEIFYNFNVLILYDREWQIRGFAASSIDNYNIKKEIIFM